MPKRNQRTLFKIIVPVLVISLIMIGAFPASTFCMRICNNCKGSPDQSHRGMLLPKEIIRGKPHIFPIGSTLNNHKSFSGLNLSFNDNNYHKGIYAALCDMKATHPLESLQGPGLKTLRAERLDINNAIINSDVSSDSRDITGFTTKQSSMARATPVPIYILTLKFLC